LRVDIVSIQQPTIALLLLSRTCPLLAADVIGDRWRGSEASVRAYLLARVFLVYQHYHPDSDGTTVAEQRCAVDPAWASISFSVFVWACQPADLCCDAAAFAERGT
jgi:hypothetical protein